MSVETSRTLSTAALRRREVITAAGRCFADKSYHGTSTTEIAAAAGLSQAYLYRLFPHKEALFVAVVEDASRRLRAFYDAVLAEHFDEGPPSMADFAAASLPMLTRDRDFGRVLLHANSAAAVPGVGEAVSTCYAEQVEHLLSHLDATPSDVRWFIGQGLLATVVGALGGTRSADRWRGVMASTG